MAEQRNLTEANVKELTSKLEEMKADNPGLKYRFYDQEIKQFDQTTNDELKDIIKKLEDKIDNLESLIKHIFDEHVLIDGIFMKIK